jgi:serine/threonine protein kinase
MSTAQPGSGPPVHQYEVNVNNQFKMGKKIGSGSFGEIYLGLDMNTNREVAVKFETLSVRRPQLIEEVRLLREF